MSVVSRYPRLVLVLLVGPALFAACGNDGEETEPTSTTSTTSTSSSTDGADEPPAGEIPVRSYFVRDEKVGPGLRFAESPERVARDAMSGLVEGPSAQEQEWGLGTEIPEGTRLLDVAISDSVATVDLSEEFEAGGGSLSMRLRVAQVVFTLTQFPTVDDVAFEIEGEPVEAIGGEGVLVAPPVDRDAFEDVTPIILVESPLPGETVTRPLTVTGSSATFEATVQMAVTDAGGQVVYDGFFTSRGANGVWGPFEETVEFDVETPGLGEVALWEQDVSGRQPDARTNLVEVPVRIR